jgi:hypothetical protein
MVPFLHHALAAHEATRTCEQDDDGDQVDDDLVQAGQGFEHHGHRGKAFEDAE